MIAVITCGHDTRTCRPQCEGAAIFEAMRFAKGRHYRLALYQDDPSAFDKPFKVLEQLSLLGEVFEVKPGLEVPKEIQDGIEARK